MKTGTRGAPWWEQVLRGERQGLLAKSVRQVARLGSLGYGLGIRGRDIAYRQGWLTSRRLPQPTICVGNITTGGTGKTPLVIRLATDLLNRGLTPAVLLRGYGRERRMRRPVLVRDPRRVLATLQESGDEAMELARRLPGAFIGVGADRYNVGCSVSRHGRVDCFILDDGFQHHRLERDINIVAIDVTDPWGGGKLLPAGLLRERPAALRRADAVVLTRTASVGPDRLTMVRAEVTHWLRPTSAVMESRHEPRELVTATGGRSLPLGELRGKKVLAISAIGNPASFEASLSGAGADIAETLRLPDHRGKPERVWTWAKERFRTGMWILLTEKDAVRWGEPPQALAGSVYALRMDLVVSAGVDHWNNLVELVRRLAHARKR
jgi:tetraacyldisaccharide 4'-kinase